MHCENTAPVEMVVYPGGTHHFLEEGKPSHSVDAITRLVDWVERWASFDNQTEEQAHQQPYATVEEAIGRVQDWA